LNGTPTGANHTDFGGEWGANRAKNANSTAHIIWNFIHLITPLPNLHTVPSLLPENVCVCCVGRWNRAPRGREALEGSTDPATPHTPIAPHWNVANHPLHREGAPPSRRAPLTQPAHPGSPPLAPAAGPVARPRAAGRLFFGGAVVARGLGACEQCMQWRSCQGARVLGAVKRGRARWGEGAASRRGRRRRFLNRPRARPLMLVAALLALRGGAPAFPLGGGRPQTRTRP